MSFYSNPFWLRFFYLKSIFTLFPAGTELFNHLNMFAIYRGYCSIIEDISWSLRDILFNYWGLPDRFKYWSIIEVPSEILFNLLRCLPLSSIYRGDIEVYCGNIDQYIAEGPRYILNYWTISTVYCEHIEVIEQFCASRVRICHRLGESSARGWFLPNWVKWIHFTSNLHQFWAGKPRTVCARHHPNSTTWLPPGEAGWGGQK